MEADVVPTPAPATIQFLRATVGYSAGDCATHFSQSQAGIQFLGLASAMVTTMGPFLGGTALHEMLKSSAADKTLLPTARQLKDILASLSPRCQLSRFPDNVLGWEVFFGKALSARTGYRSWSATYQDRYEEQQQYVKHPSEKGVKDLVEAFRQLARLGESTVTKVTVESHYLQTPWVVAFSKWCLGIPPLVFLEDGTPILSQSDSKVVVIARSDTGNWGKTRLEVNVQHSIASLGELLVSHSRAEWVGMVGIPAYGKWFLQRHGLEDDLASRALEQALQYGLKQVLSLISVRDAEVSTKRPYSEQEFSPFPDDLAVSNAASLYLNKHALLELKTLEGDLLLRDLALVKLYLESLERFCSCEECGGMENPSGCRKDHFWSDVGEIIANVLSLSLFHFPESLLVHFQPHRSGGRQNLNFQKHIDTMLRTGSPSKCSLSSLLEFALTQVGHDMRNILGNKANGALPTEWVLSCYKGQVVFPTIFETHIISQRGYMEFTWFSGLLKYNDNTYSLVRTNQSVKRARWGVKGEHDTITEADGRNVIEPCNLALTFRLVWDVQVADEVLEVSLGLSNALGEVSPISRVPGEVFENLSQSLILESCPHDSDSRLDSADPSSAYTGPIVLITGRSGKVGGVPELVGVVAVDGADDLRLFAMSYSPYSSVWGPSMRRMVVRGNNSCLKCCLDFCRVADTKILIL
jgi:hypothetical protein